jgi:hypothetical protein
VVYKSAIYRDFDFSLGLYGSRAFFDDDRDPISHLKPGKDLLSRFDYVNTGTKNMGVVGQAYLHYDGIEKSEISLGRMLVETFYTKSNDSKMIPNTFDGVVIETKVLPETKVKLAYLEKQKLRDHTQRHSVLMYGDSNTTTADKPQWSENDDAGMHRGLTYTALTAAGKVTDAPLIVGDLHNRSVENLKIDASFYIVPKLLSQAMTELNYCFTVDEQKTGPFIQDEMFYYLGFIQNLPMIPSLQCRLRLGYAQFLNDDDSDYNFFDGRFEINYLF